jgi:hypothetical protein
MPPRLREYGTVVIQSSVSLWHEAVQSIGEKCEIAIIDLSKNKDSMAWELNYLKAAKPGKVVVMLEEQAMLPASAAELNAMVVRYKADPSKDPTVAEQLRECLSRLAPPQTGTSGHGLAQPASA